jgi:hypothetical protein
MLSLYIKFGLFRNWVYFRKGRSSGLSEFVFSEQWKTVPLGTSL